MKLYFIKFFLPNILLPRLEDLWRAQVSVYWGVIETHKFIWWHRTTEIKDKSIMKYKRKIIDKTTSQTPVQGVKTQWFLCLGKVGRNPFPSPWCTGPGSGPPPAQSGGNSPCPCGSVWIWWFQGRSLKSPQPWSCCPGSQLWLRAPEKSDLHCRNALMLPLHCETSWNCPAWSSHLHPLFSIPKIWQQILPGYSCWLFHTWRFLRV